MSLFLPLKAPAEAHFMKKVITTLLFACSVFLLNGQINQFPHVEDFELEFQCPIQCANPCGLNGTFQNQSGDDLDWTSANGGTPSGNTGPTNDHTFGNAFGHHVYVESSCNNLGYPNKRADLISSYYDFSAQVWPLRMEAWYHMRGANIGDLHLDVDTTEGTGAWIIDYIPSWTDNQNLWQKKIVDLAPLIGQDSVRFRFRYITGTFAFSDAALDDIKIFSPPNEDMGIKRIVDPVSGCNLSDSSFITLELENGGLNSFFPGDTLPITFQVGTQTAVSENYVLTAQLDPGDLLTVTLTTPVDLSAIQVYSMSARVTVPNDGFPGNDLATKTFESYEVVTAPYFEDFETNDGNWEPGGANGSWAYGTPRKATIQGASSGNFCWTNGWLGSNYPLEENSYLQSPCIDVSQMCMPKISMKVWWDTEFSYDGAVLQSTTDDGQTWTQVGAFGNPENWYTDNTINARPGGVTQGWSGSINDTLGSGGWVEARNFLFNTLNSSGMRLRLAFGSDFSVNGEGIAIDDVVIYDGVYLGEDIALCGGNSVTLTADTLINDIYLWSTGATTRSITVNTPGTYWVRYENTLLTCVAYDTIEVIGVNPATYVVDAGPDTTVCGAYTLDPGVHPEATYRWSTGDSTRTLEVFGTGTYYVDVTMPCGVVRSNTVNVTILNAPGVDLGADTTVCGRLRLDAGFGAASYLWSTGDTTQTFRADQTGNYSVTVTISNGCTATDDINLVVNPIPISDMGPDTLICPGDTLCLIGGIDAVNSYQWSTGAQTQSICVTGGGVYSVENTTAAGCSNSDTIQVFFDAPRAVIDFDTNSCPIIFFFDASPGGGATSWLWDFGDSTTATVQNPIHDYTNSGTGVYTVNLTTTNRCGISDTSAVVFVSCAIGIEELWRDEVKVYPNPNEGDFRVALEGLTASEGEILVLDVLGRSVWQQPLRSISSAETIDIQLPESASGIYFVKVRLGARYAVRKVRVE